jgi:hypothetical protein
VIELLASSTPPAWLDRNWPPPALVGMFLLPLDEI